MSTEQSLDPELIEQTKEQIRGLVREITQLSKSDLSPLEFYDAMLNRVVTALAAIGGAVWVLSEGRLNLEYQINLRETRLAESPENQQRHGGLLNRVLQTGEGFLIAPHSGAAEESEGSNPTDFLLVLAPLKDDQQTQGIIEVFQRPGNNLNVQKGYLRFLLQMSELAGDYLKSRRLRHFTDRQTLWAQLEQFTRVAHRGLDPRLTAYTIANEGRRLIDCDRVTVGICKGSKCVIEAVSGQDTFDKRSNTITLLGKLATAVTATGEAVWYTGDTAEMAPQVENALQAYVDQSHSKAVGIIPLKRPRDLMVDENPRKAEPAEVIGAIIIEQIEDSELRDGMLPRVEVVVEHGCSALANSLEYHNLFLLPVWQALGKAQWVVKTRNLPKVVLAVAVLTALVLWLCFWPARFTLEGKGTLEPTERREIFASLEGVVVDVPVKHGQKVHKGDVLLRLRKDELEVSITDMYGKLASTRERLHKAESSIVDHQRSNRDEPGQLEGDLAALRQDAASYESQLKLLKKQSEQLVIKSPIDGEVITWKVRELLLGRTVHPDQVLMTVIDPDKAWELEIHMPENRMGHIAEAQKKLGPDLPVTFYLTTDRGIYHQGKVEDVHGHAELRPDEGNTVLVYVTFDRSELRPTDLREGADVTAKIDCGRVSIGYKYLHDVVAFIQTKILFRL